MTDYSDYQHLTVVVADRVAVATISAPPMNVMTRDLFVDIAKFGVAVAADDDVNVVIMRSADPDFFIAHYDVSLIVEFPVEGEPVRPDELKGFHVMCENYRTMPKVTICEIAGRIGGGGNEFAMSCDMRFGALDKMVANQMEVPLGILPGGTGTQRLPRLVGRGRAMEIILGGVDVDAATAEQWGMINRALPADELTAYVDALAAKMARYPPTAIAAAKQSVVNAEDKPLLEGLLDEGYLFETTLRDPLAQQRMARFLEIGGQTREGELRLTELLDDL